ncbi:hypothetical protein JQC92_22145 [Shewanella sp. 202IG2-18]|uniref:DUF7716 domain-containing protein n=1 Tax=Parashewanella hymeniacidonis TaxID=2807618 RepID=UPI0019614F58|nr:hypothetical protein [Parashewanella hymeniacidonis]MBM7074677.1 hypothetical protein [Parashewanella hymeniacidonis]
METLEEILLRAKDGLELGWLFLPKNKLWVRKTPAVIIDEDELSESEVNDDGDSLFAIENNLESTLDNQTIESIVASADTISSKVSIELLIEAFNYYYKHDAFLPESGFKPLEGNEYQRKLDLDFYNLLGQESSTIECVRKECLRGKISGSVFCRVHHFEMVQNKACPFTN